MAADMQYRAKGEWVEAALASMGHSNRKAVSVLRDFQVHACTDITGFGLAGHLSEMLSGQMGAEIEEAGLPCLAGATDCLTVLGIRSTLHDANRASFPVSGQDAGILFDPQTSGGLLVSIPAGQSADCVKALKDAGYEAASVIGRITENRGIRIQ